MVWIKFISCRGKTTKHLIVIVPSLVLVLLLVLQPGFAVRVVLLSCFLIFEHFKCIVDFHEIVVCARVSGVFVRVFLQRDFLESSPNVLPRSATGFNGQQLLLLLRHASLQGASRSLHRDSDTHSTIVSRTRNRNENQEPSSKAREVDVTGQFGWQHGCLFHFICFPNGEFGWLNKYR